jgi:hypothetical protein
VDVGLDAAVEATADVAVDAGETAAETGAEDAGASTAENTGEDTAQSCGGESFTAGTTVLLASGTAVPISQLRVGEKVLATNTKTGKTQAETVTAVMVRHDTDLYDLKIRAHGQTAVIDTTSNHLFWTQGTGGHAGRWVKAGALKYGTHLRTPGGSSTAVVTGGWVPQQRDGWMWDLTVPGNNDHDFYIDTTAGNILVHNTCGSTAGVTDSSWYTWAAHHADTSVLEPGEAWHPSQGTPVIGRLADTQAGEEAGFARLNVRDWSLAKNDGWVQTIIDQGGSPYVGSVTEGNYWNVARAEPSVFAREVQQFLNAGYKWSGDYLVSK